MVGSIKVFPVCSNKPQLICSSGENIDSTRRGTLSGLTSEEVHYTEHNRVTNPIDLTRDKLTEIGFDSPVVQLQRGVVRLRVELNGQTIGSGSGIIISSDGLILSVNHVPAIGQKASSSNPFDLLPGRQVLRNLRSWHELLGQEGEARLVADFPIFPKPRPPNTIFTPKRSSLKEEIQQSVSELDNKRRATRFSSFDDTIELVTIPVQILAESAQEDLMLARIVQQQKEQDPYPHIKITDTVPSKGDFVYSVGHPLGIKHNALALGEVLDSSFDVRRIEEAVKAHGIILNGIGNAFGGKCPKGNSLSEIARGLSLMFVGIDVEPLVKFLNGAVVSTNRIDHGSSGGLLCNESGEVVGITYLGMLLPFNNSALLRYSAGVLGFNARHLPLEAVTGSVGMKKAIPFLENYGVNVTHIRDGEPSGVETIEERAARKKARAAMTDLLKKQNVPDDKIPDRLREVGLGEEEAMQTSEPKPPSDDDPSYFIKCGNCSKVYKSKPQEVTRLQVDLDDTDEIAKLVFNIDLRTESGDTVRIENFSVNPAEFNIDRDVDPDTRQILINHLIASPDTLTRLNELQERAAAINSVKRPDTPPDQGNPS